jgi:signal transduction histidine kinase
MPYRSRTDQQHVPDLEREETTRKAVAAERRRIARELHDIVSHAVTVIVFQASAATQVADAAARVGNTDFAQVTQSLAHIESAGKQAIAELRRLLGMLENNHPNIASPVAGIDELGPQPGLTDLTALFASLQATGMQVTTHVAGTPRDLDPSLDTAAYRIVEEGLTNVLKHAGRDANPQLRLKWEASSLLIQIDNGANLAETRPGRAITVGRGLVGLHERTHAIGGHLHAGPHCGGGYRLTATVPFATPAEVSSVLRVSSPGCGGAGKVSA